LHDPNGILLKKTIIYVIKEGRWGGGRREEGEGRRREGGEGMGRGRENH
jgi:hypothetical protein